MNFKKYWKTLTSWFCKKPTFHPLKNNNELFDVSYFIENIKKELTHNQANHLLVNTTMNDPYYKEKIAVLFYNKSVINSIMYVEYYKLFNEQNYESPNEFHQTVLAIFLYNKVSDMPFSNPLIMNNELFSCVYRSVFPICSIKILAGVNLCITNGGNFSALREAAYSAKINSSDETFNQYCKEIELLGLGMVGQVLKDMNLKSLKLIPRKDLLNVISNIAKKYEPLTENTSFYYLQVEHYLKYYKDPF